MIVSALVHHVQQAMYERPNQSHGDRTGYERRGQIDRGQNEDKMANHNRERNDIPSRGIRLASRCVRHGSVFRLPLRHEVDNPRCPREDIERKHDGRGHHVEEPSQAVSRDDSPNVTMRKAGQADRVPCGVERPGDSDRRDSGALEEAVKACDRETTVVSRA